MTSSDRPTARDRAQAIVRDYLAGHFEIEGAAERIIDAILAAERAARAEGFREGQERMRERCAHLVWQIAKDFGFGLPMVCDAIRALPLEVDDA